jgi:hypothetical protein
MTEGSRSLARMLVATLLLSLPVTAPFALELSEVLAASRVTPPARVEFEEERHSPLFDQPLVLQGYLEYLGSGSLNKIIESPFEEAFFIEDGEIRLHRDGQTRQVSLDRSRELATIIGAIEAILSGEATRLESQFDIEVSGTIADWLLELTPTSRRVARHLSQLAIRGNGDAVATIKVDLHDGEWQVMNMLHEAPEP